MFIIMFFVCQPRVVDGKHPFAGCGPLFLWSSRGDFGSGNSGTKDIWGGVSKKQKENSLSKYAKLGDEGAKNLCQK